MRPARKDRGRSGASRSPEDREENARRRQERRERALEERLDVRPRPLAAYPVLEVRNPARQTRYLVRVPAFPAREGALCTCTDFAMRGLGTCKHLEAAWLWLDSHPAEPLPTAPPPSRERTSAVWREIDRAAEEALAAREPASVRLRRPGAPLLRGIGPARSG
jgi:hypothetical protein